LSIKEAIEKVVSALGLTIGSYDTQLDSLTNAQLNKVLENIEYANDTDVSIKRKAHVVEIDIVDDEVDFNVLTKAEYINRYGNERYDHE
jgi:hypothetical protein